MKLHNIIIAIRRVPSEHDKAEVCPLDFKDCEIVEIFEGKLPEIKENNCAFMCSLHTERNGKSFEMGRICAIKDDDFAKHICCFFNALLSKMPVGVFDFAVSLLASGEYAIEIITNSEFDASGFLSNARKIIKKELLKNG